MNKFYKQEVANVEVYVGALLKFTFDGTISVKIKNGKVTIKDFLIVENLPILEIYKDEISIRVISDLTNNESNKVTHQLSILYIGAKFTGITDVTFEKGNSEVFTYEFDITGSKSKYKIEELNN